MHPEKEDLPSPGGVTPGPVPPPWAERHGYRNLRALPRDGGAQAFEAVHEASGETRLLVVYERPEALSAEAWPDRVRRFAELGDVLVHLDHSNLARVHEFAASDEDGCLVVTEIVPGVPLDRLCGMSQKGLTRTQVGEFSRQLLEALIYLHGRPTPVMCLGLSTTGITVEEDGTLTVTDFGVSRLFEGAEAPVVLSRDRYDLDQEIRRLGRVLGRLVQPSPGGTSQVLADSRLQQVLRRCLEAPQSFKDMVEVGRVLGEVLGPGGRKPSRRKRRKKALPLAARVRRLALPLLGIAATIAALSLGLWRLYGHREYHKPGPVACAVVSGKTLVTMDASTGRVLDRRTFDVKIGDLGTDGQGHHLFLADPDGRQIVLLDGSTNALGSHALALDAEPVQMVGDSSGSYLYILTRSGNVSRANLTEVVPRVESVLAVADGHPNRLALSRDSRTLYLTSAQDHAVWAISSQNGQALARSRLATTPVRLSVSADGQQIWVLGENPESLVVLASDTLTTTATVTPSWEGGASALALSPTRPEAFVACRQGRGVVVLDTASQDRVRTVGLPSRAVSVTATPDGTGAWVLCEGGEVVRVRQGDEQATVLAELLARPSGPVLFVP